MERVATVFPYPVDGMIRGVIHSRNLNLLFEEVRKQPVAKLQILAFGVIASRDINLIGNHSKKVFQCLCAPTEIGNSILESEGVTRADVASLNIGSAISVQEKSLIARQRLAPADEHSPTA